jgi:hypothetical protein
MHRQQSRTRSVVSKETELPIDIHSNMLISTCRCQAAPSPPRLPGGLHPCLSFAT